MLSRSIAIKIWILQRYDICFEVKKLNKIKNENIRNIIFTTFSVFHTHTHARTFLISYI